MHNFFDNPLAIIGAAIAGTFAVSFLLISGISHTTFPGEVASIEQLRSDAPKTACQNAEDVVGQVTAANQAIMAAKAYDRVPLFGLAVPDGWRHIQTIDIPQQCAAS